MNNPFEFIDARLSNIETLLLDIKHKPQTLQENPDQLLTRAEACDLLKIEQTTLYHWTRKGKIQCYGIANRRYYKKAELLECLTPLKQ